MAMVISTNVASLDSQKHLARTQVKLNQSMARLSSGLRINSAADDAAGLALSETLKSQTRSYQQAERNANDGLSYLQTMDGGMNEVHEMLGRMRELAVQSSTGTLQDSQRSLISNEFVQLRSEIDRVAESTQFNGFSGLNGGVSTITAQVGIGTESMVDHINIEGLDLTTTGLGVDSSDVNTSTAAQASITALDTAISSVSSNRSTYGAQMNRLQTTVSNLQNVRLNLTAANSRIRDTDVAEESAQLTRQQILTQAASSVLQTANQLPQIALGLLG